MLSTTTDANEKPARPPRKPMKSSDSVQVLTHSACLTALRFLGTPSTSQEIRAAMRESWRLDRLQTYVAMKHLAGKGFVRWIPRVFTDVDRDPDSTRFEITEKGVAQHDIFMRQVADHWAILHPKARGKEAA